MTTDEINRLLKPLLPKDKRAFVGIGKRCIFHALETYIGIPVTIKGVHFDTDGIMVACKGMSSVDLVIPIDNLFQNYMEVYERFGNLICGMTPEWQNMLLEAKAWGNTFEMDLYAKNINLAKKLSYLHEKKMKKKQNRQ